MNTNENRIIIENAEDYVRATRRTRGERDGILTQKDLLLLGVMGLGGEAGEVVDALKKVIFQGHQLDPEKFIEELGDVLWYAAAIIDALGTTFLEVMQFNVDKISELYPDGFDAEVSRTRNREDC